MREDKNRGIVDTLKSFKWWNDKFDSNDDHKLHNMQVKKIIVEDYRAKSVGSSGTQIFSGYFHEDVNREFNDPTELYYEMGLSDPKVKMCLQAVKYPIMSANWSIEPADDSDEALKQAELVEYILFKKMPKTWTNLLEEILTCVDFGYSVFECSMVPFVDDEKFNSFIGIKDIGFRNQRTLEKWVISSETGELEFLEQRVYGDLKRSVMIPANNLMIFSIGKLGDNYRGTSALRSCVGPYKRKNFYLELMGKGLEKSANLIPVVQCQNESSLENVKGVIDRYLRSKMSYIILTPGTTVDLKSNNFDPNGVMKAIENEDAQIVGAFGAQFMELGKGGVGSYALSFDQSDFFLGGIEFIATKISEVINQKLIPSIINLNFANKKTYPKLVFSGIRDRAGKELAEIVDLLVKSKALIPDDHLEDSLRQKYRLPKKSDEGQRIVDNQNEIGNNKELTFAEKSKKSSGVVSLIDSSAEKIKELMVSHLNTYSQDIISNLIKEYKKLPASNKIGAISSLDDKTPLKFKKDLEDLLGRIAFKAIASARKEVPKRTKFAEKDIYEWDLLPKQVMSFIKMKSKLLADHQTNELASATYFQFESSLTSTDSSSILEHDLKEAAAQKIEGTLTNVGAVNAASDIVNKSRNAFFLSKEVAEDIESFTFTNADPKSEICKDLNGKTFFVNDPHATRYYPPLHHLCKSYLVPNFKGEKDAPDITPGGLKPSMADLEKFITF
ncbi:MAG: hypothetical protein HQK52_19420 [Oligoflexia bacterium]|nr:hypothetical protein [Oligoflexia bacterium]